MEEAGVGHSAHPVHRELRRYVKATHDRRTSSPYLGSRDTVSTGGSGRHDPRITDGDFFSIPDRYGRFHSGCDRAGARDYAAFLGFFFLEPS